MYGKRSKILLVVTCYCAAIDSAESKDRTSTQLEMVVATAEAQGTETGQLSMIYGSIEMSGNATGYKTVVLILSVDQALKYLVIDWAEYLILTNLAFKYL